jgi:hypothetical protein
MSRPAQVGGGAARSGGVAGQQQVQVGRWRGCSGGSGSTWFRWGDERPALSEVERNLVFGILSEVEEPALSEVEWDPVFGILSELEEPESLSS